MLFPTKSAIYGMILAALGQKGSKSEVEVLDSNIQQINCYMLTESRIFSDFQLHGSLLYEGRLTEKELKKSLLKDIWTSNIPAGRNGNRRAQLKRKQYLDDPEFAIVLEVEDSFCDKLSKAFVDPVWPIYIGRANCFYHKFDVSVFDTLAEAEKDISQWKLFATSTQIEDYDEITTLNDSVIQFGEYDADGEFVRHAEYMPRRVFVKHNE